MLLRLATVAVIALSATAVVHLYTPRIEREAYETLDTVARLKAEQLAHWLQEHRGDHRVLMRHEPLIAAAETLQHPDAGPQARDQALGYVRERLDIILDAQNFAHAALLGRDGTPLLRAGKPEAPHPALHEYLAEALATRQPLQSSPYIGDHDGVTSIDFVVPLLHRGMDHAPPSGAVVLHKHLDDSIIDLILDWPAQTRSSEVLLARREGQSLIFIARPRLGSLPGQSMALPLEEFAHLPTAIALRAREAGAARTFDYRGVEILAAYVPVSGTNWVLVAKTDRAEVLAPFMRMVLLVTALLAGFALVLMALLGRFWRAQAENLHLAERSNRLELLMESEARYRAITESAQEAIITADAAGRIVDWNPAAEALFGYPRSEIVGQPLVTLAPVRMREAADARYHRMMHQNAPEPRGSYHELLARHRDGHDLLVQVAASRWRTAAGDFSTFTLRDIGEQRRYQLEREEALARLEKMAANLPGVVYQFRQRSDGSSCVPYASPALRDIFRVPPAEVVEDATKLFDRVHPDDLADLASSIDESASELFPWNHEFRLRFPDGSTIWLLGMAIPQREPDGSTLWHGFITDNTRNREQQDTLREMLAINESILQNALVGIVYFRDRHIVSCNLRFAELFGYAPSELPGLSVEHLHVSHENYVNLGVRAYSTLATGAIFSEEIPLRRKDGSTFLAAVNGRAIDPACPLEGSIWVYADISEQRAAEQESLKLKLAVEQAPVSIVITDPQAMIEYVNPTFSRITGYSAREAIGRNPSLLKSGETAPEVYRQLWETISTGRTWRGTLHNRTKDGRLIWEDTSISPIVDEYGAITHYVAVKEDVTERMQAERQLRESEEAFRRLFEDVNDPLLLIREDRFVDCNAAAVEILGYTSKEALLNHGPSEISPPLQPDGRRSDEKAAEILGLMQESGILRFEWVHLRADGSEIPVEVTLTPITLRGERLIHTSWRDITERRRVERTLAEHQAHLEEEVRQRTAQLSEALEAARQADRTKDEFLANISHELRTPLSAMIGFANLARPLATDPRLRDYLEKIAHAGTTLSGIINDLLDLSKIAAGRMELESTTFRLRDLIARSRSVLSWKAQEKGLELVEWIDEDVPDALVGDTLRLEQIVINLLNNAIKFTPAGTVSLHLSVHERSAEQICLQIEVEDTGIGMNEDQLQKLFKPFSQSDASISRRFGGSGLGLAICKQLAELMHGSIRIHSREGAGTLVQFQVQLGLGREAALPANRTATRRPPSSTHYRDARVLVVDDQPFNREIVKGLLEVCGITPDLATNGQEALERLKDAGPQGYDLVLMDVQMPVLDGLAATRAVRELPGFDQLPIIAMTAHTMAHERKRAVAAGMTDHIGKPFDEAGFYAILERWIPAGKQFCLIDTLAAAPPPTANGLPALDGVDTTAGLALLLGDVTRYRHWLTSFIEDGPACLAQARHALAIGQRDAAAIAVHTLKGRTGLLGMKALHARATRLEEAIEADEAVQEPLRQTEEAVEAMCAQLRDALGQPANAPASDPDPDGTTRPCAIPEGPRPPALERLIRLLEAGDADCDHAHSECLAELAGTPWSPVLERAAAPIRNFQFAAALELLRPTEEPSG